MKIVHLADLHIGRRLNDLSLLDDQRYVLNQIIEAFDTIKPHVLIIAGDVYDKANPSSEAFEVWNDFLTQLAQQSIHVLIISGNHDSQERLGVGRALFEEHDIYLASHYTGAISSVTLHDDFGPVHFYLFPYIKPSMVRNYHPEFTGNTFQEAFEFIFQDLKINQDERNVAIAHQFVIGNGMTPILSDSEIGPSVGGLDAIDASLFKAFDYVALGHIHRPQAIGRETIRYAGSPLKYSFSECMHSKQLPIIDLNNDVSLSFIDIKPLRDVRLIKGPLEKLYEIGKVEGSEDYIHAVLTDDIIQGDALHKLRSVYPNLVSLDFDNTRTSTETSLERATTILEQKPFDLFNTFFTALNGRDFNQEESDLVKAIIDEIQEEIL
ncbi:exonuclease SbcCD subunit D C-terminal domain-containing protein [Erysipelothrix sp. strain 2 (EsS2-6-Brazil)]|uniref:exonuclease SbcCD subunit D C-terminal domain-containing protein n=1 Tax=Erysipelothrix sp. strain 2 (EsS2-6-Brazil) TaxID=2500549 RepID=UPI00190A3C38|nr:exonuclease SbcCD subunit D [Erysipelothrix sp. strain 2 (EsS2-6-Brazil)]